MIFESLRKPNRDNVAAELSILLKKDESRRMDEGLRKKVQAAIDAYRDTPTMSERELGETLQDIVIPLTNESKLDRAHIKLILKRLHKGETPEGAQPDWNGIVLIELLRLIEKKGKVTLH